jgi:hypothetical protein
MRREKRSLPRRVNGNLRVQFGDEKLTSYAGLEVLGRFLRASRFNEGLRRAFHGVSLRGDYPLASMVRLMLGLLWVGGRRLRHVRFLGRDPMVRRFAGLDRLPDERTLSRWLKQFSQKTVARFARLNFRLVVERIQELGLKLLTLDVDGSVLPTGLTAEWAARGFNPHHRKVPSYYPILAHEAQTGQIVGLRNRPGNVHDGKKSEAFLRGLIQDLREAMGKRVRLEFRMDGAFFQRQILEMMLRERCDFAIKVPMWRWLGLKGKIQARKRWRRITGDVSAFELELPVRPWDLQLRVVCYRKKVYHPTRKNFQLDLFSPDDGTYEYSAVTTNKALSMRRLWHFMAGRGAQEKTLAELKDGLAFGTIPTNHYGANSAWQWLVVLAHNLFRDFQLSQEQSPGRRRWKKTFLYTMESIKSARFEWLNVAGRLLTLAEGTTLRLPATPALRERWSQMIPDQL